MGIGLHMIEMWLARCTVRQFNEKISNSRNLNSNSMIDELQEDHLQITKMISTLNKTTCHYYFFNLTLMIVVFIANLYLLSMNTGSDRPNAVFIVWILFDVSNMLLVAIPAIMLNEEIDDSLRLFFERHCVLEGEQTEFVRSVRYFFVMLKLSLGQKQTLRLKIFLILILTSEF